MATFGIHGHNSCRPFLPGYPGTRVPGTRSHSSQTDRRTSSGSERVQGRGPKENGQSNTHQWHHGAIPCNDVRIRLVIVVTVPVPGSVKKLKPGVLLEHRNLQAARR
eukprot:3685946-Rhodomonas_salina.1